MDALIELRTHLERILGEVNQAIADYECARHAAEVERRACRERLYSTGCPASRADTEHGDDDGQVEPPA
jgi:hypothetical protein